MESTSRHFLQCIYICISICIYTYIYNLLIYLATAHYLMVIGRNRGLSTLP